MKIIYKEHSISFSSAGEFSARVNGVMVTKDTLKALKNKIDEALKKPFKSFDAFIEVNDGKLTKISVIGVKKMGERSMYSKYAAFVYTLPGGTVRQQERHQTILVATAENVKAFRAAKNHEAQERALRRAQDRLDNAIKSHDPDEYAT